MEHCMNHDCPHCRRSLRHRLVAGRGFSALTAKRSCPLCLQPIRVRAHRHVPLFVLLCALPFGLAFKLMLAPQVPAWGWPVCAVLGACCAAATYKLHARQLRGWVRYEADSPADALDAGLPKQK
jgi:hypothetical protein